MMWKAKDRKGAFSSLGTQPVMYMFSNLSMPI